MKHFTEWQKWIINTSHTNLEYVLHWKNHISESDTSDVIEILTSRELWRIKTIDELEGMIDMMRILGANHFDRYCDKEGNSWITLGYKRTKEQLLEIEIKNKQKELDALLNKKNQ